MAQLIIRYCEQCRAEMLCGPAARNKRYCSGRCQYLKRQKMLTVGNISKEITKAIDFCKKEREVAAEMINMAKIVSKNALRRQRRYSKIIKAIEAGDLAEAKKLHRDMKTWKDYKII